MWEVLLNILNKGCENVDLKLIEFVALFRLMTKPLFLRFPRDYRMVNFEAKLL